MVCHSMPDDESFSSHKTSVNTSETACPQRVRRVPQQFAEAGFLAQVATAKLR